MSKLLVLLAFVALCGLVAAPALAVQHPSTESNGPRCLTPADNHPFTWQGSVQVQCRDGSCRVIFGGGIVYANSDFEARLQAQASLESQASSQGTVLQGTLSITIRGR